MEFWGLEVKPGTIIKCEPGHGFILHLSQAALGESKKSDSALVYVIVDDQKFAVGTLSIDKYPHIQCDLIFDKEFELSHTSKTTSVFFTGYKVEQPTEEDEMDLDSEDEGELNIPAIKENGKADGKEQKSQEKAIAATSKSSLASRHVEKKSKDDDDSDEDETDDSDEGEGQSSEEGDDDDSSDEDDTSEDEEETPTPNKKPEAGKKRSASANTPRTHLSDKKAKVATTPPAQKTDGKKAATHVATPYPAKQAGKTPANNDKSKEKSPRSGGSVVCKSCSKTFNSEMALQAHSKAKHRAK